MRRLSSIALVFSAFILCGSLTGCLFRTRQAEHTVPKNVVLQQATLDQLVQQIDAAAAKIKTLNATVDIATSLGGPKKGKVTELTEIRGYILMRNPDMLRMYGIFPVVRNRAFDMASDGKTFRLWLPTKNKFVVGSTESGKPSSNTLENLRPHVFFDSLLLHEIHPDEIPVLEQDKESVRNAKTKKIEDYPDYVVDVIKKENDRWLLSRKIIFSRVDLKPHRQLIYDKTGQLATEAVYQNFTDYDGISFPSQVTINRPQEEYSILLTIVKLRLNEPLTGEQFDLKQPEGSQLQVLK